MADPMDQIRANKPHMKNGVLFWLRIVQSVVALLVLAMVAFVMSQALIVGVFGGLNIFTCIFTWWCVIYSIVFPRFLPRAHYTLIELVLEFFHGVFWCASFGLLAVYAAAFSYTYYVKRDAMPKGGKSGSSSTYGYGYDDGYTGSSGYYFIGSSGTGAAIAGCTKVGAAFGGLLFASTIGIFIYLLVIYVRERRARRELLQQLSQHANPAIVAEQGQVGMQMTDVKGPVASDAQYAQPPQQYPPQQQQQYPPQYAQPGQAPVVYTQPTQ